MPVFMDRHDLRGATAEDIGEAHRKDLEVQDSYGVKFLTYWLDAQRGTTFCLVEAPDKETVRCVHREAHGGVPSDIIEVPLAAVEAFLGRVHDPAPADGDVADVDSGHRAVMFTDIVGSTEMTTRLGDRLSTELVRAHDAVVRRCLAQFRGREVKHTGDGIMASFASIVDAVECTSAIQRELEHYNRGSAEDIHVRIGLDCGDPVADSNDLFGSTVQRAARLCAAAAPDQILASEDVRSEHGDPLRFKRKRRRRLKGFAEPVPVFEISWMSTATPEDRERGPI